MTATTIVTSTTLQRSRITKALRNAGRPSAYLTDEHADVFQRAGIEPQYGIRVDAFLRSLSYTAASRFLNAIQQIEEPA